MSSTEQTLMVIGHKNPDTDSICSAIAYARYKQDVTGVPAVPYRAGNLNPQTAFVLEHFGVHEPHLVTSLLPRLSDIMIHGPDLLALTEQDSLGKAQEIITGKRFAFLPVTGDEGKYAGKISALRLAELPQDLGGLCEKEVTVSFRDLVESISGTIGSGEVPEIFQGRVWFQGLGGPLPPEGGILAVISDSQGQGVAELIARGAFLIVSRGSNESTAMPTEGCVIATSKHPLDIAARICLSMPLGGFIERRDTTFKPYDLVREVQKEIRKSNEGGFIVVDDEGFMRGVITRLSFLTQWRFRVALVDHNELSQAVDGVEEANVEEIIDHHRLGYRSTDQPITFINKVVGCTCTIIAELYRNARREPPPAIAGLMLAAILSDTVILQSPTTTPFDREMAEWLAGLAGEDLHAFGARMFAAGCSVEGVDPGTIIRQDLKVFEESGWKISVSQMETVGFDPLKEMKPALAAELAEARKENGCHFSCLMVTDITSSSSLLLCTGEEKIIAAISYPHVGENLFEMSGVLSRKKQMMPYLADLLRELGA